MYSAYTQGMPALGSQLMQLSITTAGGRLRQIDMVFANKGDSAMSRERDFRSYFRRTRKAVEGALRGAQCGQFGAAGAMGMAIFQVLAALRKPPGPSAAAAKNACGSPSGLKSSCGRSRQPSWACEPSS